MLIVDFVSLSILALCGGFGCRNEIGRAKAGGCKIIMMDSGAIALGAVDQLSKPPYPDREDVC